MSIERGKDLLAGIFANYGIDINTWATYSPEKQQQMASEYKNNKASEQLDDQPPYEAQNIPNTEPSSMQGFLKKARLHDPQGAADLMNAENTPVQTNTDVSEPEIIPKTRGLQPRLAVPQVGLMAKRIAYDKEQKEKLIKRLAIERDNAEANALESQTGELRPEKEERPQNQHEAAMGDNYLYKMPSSKNGGGEDAKKWAAESAEEPSIIKEDDGLVQWNKEGFEKYNPFTDKDPTGDIFGESREGDYDGFLPPESEKTPSVVPKTTGTKVEHTPHGRPESYDYDKADYEGKVKTTPKRTEKFISRYKVAKTKKEKEEALPTDKDERAAVKEQADRYWIDPRTGFALNLTEMDKRMDRKSEMAMAALFPAGDRAAYLYSKKLIDKEDYEMMIKPSEKEEAATLLSKVKRKETILKIKKLEQDSKRNPQEKNWIDLFKNAVTNDNYIMQEILGRKLGFSDSDLKKSRDLSKSQELAKLAGSGKAFKTQFDVEYSTVIGNKAKWQSRSSSVVYGSQDAEFELGGLGGKPSKFTDRRGYFKSYGLYEQADAQSMDRSRLNGILMKAPMARTFMADPRYEGSDGKFDAIKFVNDTDAYERYLYDTLVFEGMSSLYQPKIYAAMMKYQAKNTKKGTFAKKLTNNNK
tara:strand:+ start:656 stop:2578 length:1923 start_codon:yes stop_codon:yes gene_type:complete